ncbi:CDP-alcohol phosphatidyltransferase family protein [Deferrisoma camini]|uniref:CDP-alcohol phosphatidyltransferase family protein n=1 Tax=Deferrisoma camini TaxID=1035120 RepID=UPI00046D8EFD|nr:CDP-alcohol phosphatidyltransferase family protein [Deferrisoma camini]
MLAGGPAERAFRGVLQALVVGPLTRRGVSPDTLTGAGLVLSAVAGGLAWAWPVAAGVTVLVGGVMDALDGSLARAAGKATRAGAFLDSTLDRYGEFLVLAGLWLRASATDHPLAAGAFALAAVQGALMVSYARARAEGLGHPLRGGWFERPERVLLMALGLLASPWEGALGLGRGGAALATLAVLAAGANATALDRIRRGRRALRAGEG